MSLFFLIFFTIYGSVHAYALLKAKAALSFGWKTTLAAVPLLLGLALAPVVVYFLSRHGLERAARAASWIGYVWMGLLFFFFWTNLALDVVNLAARAVSLLSGQGARPLVPYTRPAFLAMLALTAVLGIYGFLEASRIGVERVRVATTKLPPSVSRVRIVQISDVHLGLIVGHRKAKAIARLVAEAEPDIFVSTGDLVDAAINRLEGLSEIFGAVRPPLGKYAVTGNHEYYAGIGQAKDFTRRAGFTLLAGESAKPGNVLRLAGVNDEAASARGDGRGTKASEALKDGPSPLFTILLKHRPHPPPGVRGLVDLQLSGHTHNGQIFPFRLVSRIPYPYVTGLFGLDDGSLLRVSRGTGTWGPPMRFLSPPEVTIIDIERRP